MFKNFWITALLSVLLIAQTSTSALIDFGPPVRGGIQLTGTFCELRGNHFHGGLDIRGGVGRPIYAIADGFVSRIKISVSGYGQGLYLEHPSGHTSVYGHLDRFRDDIMGFTRDLQYTREQFTLDERLPAEIFPVKKGDIIGYMGQRGYVSGPHLHFEIRDTKTERTLNPMNFGITAADSRRPSVRLLRLYTLDERGNTLDGQNYRVRSLGGGRYRTEVDTVYVDQKSIGFGIKTYDQQDGRPNWNGVYGISMAQDDSTRFAFQMDHFAGDQTRYLNAHLDYREQQQNDSWFHRCFRLPGNQLDFYQTDEQDGRLVLSPGQTSEIQFTVKDHKGNTAQLRLIVKRRQGPAPLQNRVYTYFLPYDEESLLGDEHFRAHFPEGTLYEDLYLDYDFVADQSADLYAPTHRLGNHWTPLHRYYDLHIRPERTIPNHLNDKAVIAYCEDGESPKSYGGEWQEDGRLRAPVRALGNFSIMLDTEAPTIRPYRWQRNMQGWESFSFNIEDNFKTAGKARGLRYRAEVDGQWVLMQYDLRTKRLFHQFDDRIGRGEHRLILRVMDDRGNEEMFEGAFVR